jgi:hypothetical protein
MMSLRPRVFNALTIFDPMKPAPPVTMIIFDLVYWFFRTAKKPRNKFWNRKGAKKR